LNREFLKRLARTSLGEAAAAAKAAITDIDARRTWILFGDPTLFGTPGSKGGGLPPGPDGGAPDGSTHDGSMRDGATSDGATSDGARTDAVAGDGRAKTDAGTALDGGPDAADGAPADGCGCRLDPKRAPPGAFLFGLALLVLATRRRPRGARRTQASAAER
jgi:MYXO-CTERM domain-containing protein